MIIKGTILDIDDINQKTFVNRDTGESTVSGEVVLTVSKPTQTIKVKVNTDLWQKSNKGDSFKKVVGQQLDYFIEQKEYSFVRDGQPFNGSTNNLFRLPQVSEK